jgi:hypothetical protein
MKIEEYGEYLEKQDVPAETIESRLSIIGDFTNFLVQHGLTETAAGKEEADGYAGKLIASGRNSVESFSALRDYAGWLGQRRLYVALVELMDCRDAMAVLAREVEARHGRETRDLIFREALPPLGADEKQRCAHTRTITERMSRQMTPEEIRAAWFRVQHGIPAGAWRESDREDKEKYRRCGNLDEFLDLRRRERDAFLTRLRDENKLWYTVEITDEVLAFIKSNPEIEAGRREGDKIYITKVPYNAAGYLHETDARMKRYHACHCPLAREAILQDTPVSPDICNCSLGHASHYLAGLGQALEGVVLESAIKGDTRCRFVFELPDKDSDSGDRAAAEHSF